MRDAVALWTSLSLALAGCGSTALPAIDAGSADAGLAHSDASVDAGDDAGDDAGVADDGGLVSGLTPMDPACAGRDGGEDCWKEWLKEDRAPEFNGVGVGERGIGPWPDVAWARWEAIAGLATRIIGVSVDTDQNIYAVSRDAFFLLRAGGSVFERHDRGEDGLRDYPLLSVAGGGSGVAYLGFEGAFGIDPDSEPEDVRRSGDVQKLVLGSKGFTATTWDTHNSNTPLSGKYDHTRSIFEMVVPRRGPAAGELYLGTEHGIVRYRAEGLYADHRHIATMLAGSQRFGHTGALAVDPTGTVWYGNEFAFGGLAWTPRLAEWYIDAQWIAPGQAFGGDDDRDMYEGAAFDSRGDVWMAARGRGLAHLLRSDHQRIETFSLPNDLVNDLVVDLDDTLWLATDGGLYRGSARGDHWDRVAEIKGGAYDLFVDDTVSPRTIWIAGASGVAAYRGP